MKKLLVLAMICVAAFTVQAQKAELTDDQKAVKKEMLAKYDTNKDGKLDKEERAKMSAEDKAKWEKAFPKKKKKTDDNSAAAPATPAK
jgi:hypothetical protein